VIPLSDFDPADLTSVSTGTFVLTPPSGTPLPTPSSSQIHIPDPSGKGRTRKLSNITPDNVDLDTLDLWLNGSLESGVEGGTPLAQDDDAASAIGEELEEDRRIPQYLKPYAVVPVEWDATAVVKPPVLLHGILHPYQQARLEWLSIHTRNLNCILCR